MTRTDLQPETLPDPRPRYTQGILAEGRLLFIAGQVAVDRENRVIGKGDPGRQAEQVFENIHAVLGAAGASFANLVMTTTYLTDIAYRAPSTRRAPATSGPRRRPTRCSWSQASPVRTT